MASRLEQIRSTFLSLCVKGLEKRGMGKDARYRERLKIELKAVDAAADHEYFVNLYTKFQKEKLQFPKNEWNNLVDWVLFLTPNFDIEREGTYIQGEFPDIDTDFIDVCRNHLKRVWAPKTFGQENICEIGSNTTIGIKSALLDTARVYGEDHDEIQSITRELEDKDDDGDPLEWDKAMEMYPQLKEYCDAHPDVTKDAYLALDRNKAAGVHAAGLIISSQRIDGFVPLEVRMVNKDNPDGVICSAWPEGQNTQDLQPVGLIKFDLLVVKNLMQIALACKFVKERHGIDKICAQTGSWDWSDIAYLNDPKAIDMANRADLKCIFQFNGEGIRKLVKRGGITSFEDQPAYSSLYRPGPLTQGMDVRYCRRKKGEEPFNIHPILQKSLGVTYGVMCYQEQIMDILRVVGNIPDMHTESIRKAISKKKIEIFGKYKEMFIENGKINLDVNAEFCIDMWNQVEAFSAYGFNKSHAVAYSYISARLLYLKAHYPIEFYTAIMMCEDKDDKLKEYKYDAEQHGVVINPVHINKSRQNFSIEDEEIFFGFKNLKGIGDADADRIVTGQPYKDYVDFLTRFGADAKVASRLTALGCFDEPHDRLTLRKFAEHVKDIGAKRRARQKRFEDTAQKKLDELKEILLTQIPETDPDFEACHDFDESSVEMWHKKFEGVTRDVEYKAKGQLKTKQVPFVELLEKLRDKRKKSFTDFHDKEQASDEEELSLDEFDASTVELKPEEIEILTSELTINGKKTFPKAEGAYYGFQWKHRIETCLDYKGHTLDAFLSECDQDKTLVAGPVEVQLNAVRARTAKNGVKFWSIEIEDANSKIMSCNMWSNDHERFKDDLIPGNMVRMRVRPPSGGFNTLTFESVPRKEQHKLPKNREDDYRLIVLKSMTDDQRFENQLAGFEIQNPDTELMAGENSDERTDN